MEFKTIFAPNNFIEMQNFTGKIRLKSGGHPIDVQINATSPQAATKAIEAQYAGQIQSWVKHMASK